MRKGEWAKGRVGVGPKNPKSLHHGAHGEDRKAPTRRTLRGSIHALRASLRETPRSRDTEGTEKKQRTLAERPIRAEKSRQPRGEEAGLPRFRISVLGSRQGCFGPGAVKVRRIESRIVGCFNAAGFHLPRRSDSPLHAQGRETPGLCLERKARSQCHDSEHNEALTKRRAWKPGPPSHESSLSTSTISASRSCVRTLRYRPPCGRSRRPSSRTHPSSPSLPTPPRSAPLRHANPPAS